MLQLLHDTLKKSLSIHATRLKRLMTTVSCLLSHANLSVASLGRKTKGPAKVKNKIKAVDRLVSNAHLYAEQIGIYKILTQETIGQMIDLDIVVDWSSAGNNKFHLLRASVVFDERAVRGTS